MKFTSMPLLRKWALAGSGVLAGLLLLSYAYGCFQAEPPKPNDEINMVLEWNRCLLEAEVVSEGHRGPIVARTYGYVGLAAYEAALPGLAGDFQSLSARFPDLELPESPSESVFNSAIALNACYSVVIGRFYLSSPEPVRHKRVSLEDKWERIFARHLDTAVVRISREYGRSVGLAVYLWSTTDSLGYRANHHNYDRNYTPPEGEGLWVTSADFPMPALLPYWGGVRTFLADREMYLAQPLPPYSTATNQLYYVQALELISLSKSLSSENQWIAEFWNDDQSGFTFTPPGHWLAITNQVIEMERPSLEKTLETYLRFGLVMADVMITCFYSKYHYNLERPETFIQKHIDKSWRPATPSPSFPAYPSGHAMMGAATAEVLTQLYGDTFRITDKSHQNLRDFSVRPRTFNSFHEMAKENALSRILLGVHWRMDCEEGLRQGLLLGKEINALQLEIPLTK